MNENEALDFVSYSGQVLSATVVFLSGFVFAVVQHRKFRVCPWNAISYYIWHTIFCIFYFTWSLSNVADATAYYTASLDPDKSFGFGTTAIVYLTRLFSSGLGMSYGGVFLVYNLFGFIGMIAFAGALRELLSGAGRYVRLLSHLVLLSPGLSFWSSAIGKDSLAFMGAGLACWAALDFGRRYPAMLAAIAAFFVARPHMAGVLLACLALTMIVLWRTSLFKKMALVAITVPITVLAVQFALQYVGLGSVSDLADVARYIEARQGYNMEGGSSVDIGSMPMIMRFFTYLFRPLFFDPLGLLGVGVSIENAFYLFLFLLFCWRCITRRSALPLFPRAFFFIFSAVALFLLANTTANLGIAIRQKWMFMPMLLMLMFSFIRRPLSSARIDAANR